MLALSNLRRVYSQLGCLGRGCDGLGDLPFTLAVTASRYIATSGGLLSRLRFVAAIGGEQPFSPPGEDWYL